MDKENKVLIPWFFAACFFGCAVFATFIAIDQYDQRDEDRVKYQAACDASCAEYQHAKHLTQKLNIVQKQLKIAQEQADENRAWADEWQLIIEAATGGDGVGQEYINGAGVINQLSLYMEWTQRWRQALYDLYKRRKSLPEWAKKPHHYPEELFPLCERKHWLKLRELWQDNKISESKLWPIKRFCNKTK